jgi:hypothetical protein
MTAEEALARTFAEHEDLTPDAEAVLAGIHAELSGRRRRILAVAGAAAAAAAVAIGTAVLVEQQRPAPPPPASTPHRTAAVTEVGIDTTWLPPGTARTTMRGHSYGVQFRVYEVTGADKVTTTVELRMRAGSRLAPLEGDAPPKEFGFRQHDLTIAGRPAREWRNDTGSLDTSYTLVVRVPENRVVQVAVSVPLSLDGRGAALAAIGERVAGSLRLDRPEPIGPEIRPSYVPAGLVVRGVGWWDLGGTYWELAAPTAVRGGAAVLVSYTEETAAAGTPLFPVKNGRPVQGHRTKIVTMDKRFQLWIDEFRPGHEVGVDVTGAAASLQEAYKIADGVHWTG